MLGNSFDSAQDAPLFSYRTNPVHERGFQILKRNESADYSPVGEYLVLDKKEEYSLSEKKVINLISLLNGRKALSVTQDDVAGSRLLYSRLPSEGVRTKFMFYQYTGKGVSVENALFMINKEDLPNV